MKSKKQILLLVFFGSVLINSLMLVAQWYALSSSGSQVYLQYAMWLLIPITLVMLFIPIIVLGLALPYKRKRTLLVLAACTMYSASGFVFAKLSMIYREHAFDKLAEHSQPLILAIERYEKELGYPPETLQRLVPTYLSAVPGTAMGAYPNYSYETSKESGQKSAITWTLYISIPTSGLGKSEEKFVYMSSEYYLVKLHDQVIRRVGNWIYIREK